MIFQPLKAVKTASVGPAFPAAALDKLFQVIVKAIAAGEMTLEDSVAAELAATVKIQATNDPTDTPPETSWVDVLTSKTVTKDADAEAAADHWETHSAAWGRYRVVVESMDEGLQVDVYMNMLGR